MCYKTIRSDHLSMPPANKTTRRNLTVGDMQKQSSAYVTCQCLACGHTGRVSLKKVREMVGDGFGWKAAVKRMYCSKCGSKDVKVD